MAETHDHTGAAVRHGRARVNGIRMHYVTAGAGEPLLLVHGTPKTHYYWHRLVPLLTERFTVVAPDLRGFGDTDTPTTGAGYDSDTNVADLAELMTTLGHDTFHVHGEDRGAEFAYVMAARHPDRVRTLSFAEMLLSGLGLEEWTAWTPETVSAQFDERGVWLWHLPFFWIPDLAEMLITGKERQFWSWWIKQETYNPTAITADELDVWVSYLARPGGMRGVMETYRAAFVNAGINRELAQTTIDMPVAAIGVPEFFSVTVGQEMRKVASDVRVDTVFDECGHSVALEAPERLAEHLRSFMLGG